MADEVDQANDLVEKELQFRLAEQRSKNLKNLTDFGPEFCEDCGEDMVLFRRQMGLRRCVQCVSSEEHRRKTVGF